MSVKISPLGGIYLVFFEKVRFQAAKLCIHFFRKDFCRIFGKRGELRRSLDGRSGHARPEGVKN